MVVVQQLEAAGTFDALSDPTRLAILQLLRGRDQCVCHLVEALGLKQSLISHHIGLLRRAGLVATYPHPNDRRWIYYRLNRDAVAELAAQLAWLGDPVDYDPDPTPCPIDLPAGHAE